MTSTADEPAGYNAAADEALAGVFALALLLASQGAGLALLLSPGLPGGQGGAREAVVLAEVAACVGAFWFAALLADRKNLPRRWWPEEVGKDWWERAGTYASYLCAHVLSLLATVAAEPGAQHLFFLAMLGALFVTWILRTSSGGGDGGSGRAGVEAALTALFLAALAYNGFVFARAHLL